MSRPTTRPEVSFQLMVWALYFAAAFDDERRWYCQCGAVQHHRMIAWDCFQETLNLFFLEVNKCSVSRTS